MSRYRGPRLRIVRRLGSLEGFTSKIPKKQSLPGQQLFSLGKKVSQYYIRLKEKQKLRFYYGITECQLLNYLKKAKRKKGSLGRTFLTLLEMRLDNIIFRLCFASTIAFARQLVVHGHILVNGFLVTSPGYSCSPNDQIEPKPASRLFVKNNLNSFSDFVVPLHLKLNPVELQGKVINYVNRKSLSLTINELLVVEYYSRKL
jgi:small subunit ribosomal protein S4